MKKDRKIKTKISVSINADIIELLDEKTSNRSNYLDRALLDYLYKNGADISKIKL
jgi:hypothetical protein